MKRFEYLSIRVMALLAAALCIHLFLIAVLLFLAFMGHAPFWPAILSLVLLLGLLWWFGAMILKPYLHMERTMRLFLDGYTTADLTHLCQTAPTPMVYQMLAHMMKIMDSSELLKLNKRQAQYLALQNQINPHFLYNTLESIRSEALIAGLTGVADMTEALAAFFRYTISKVENLVSVEEELENCQTYFRIQQYRFGSRLDLTIECDPEEREEIYGCRLPKLTMQPILENSIIHGTECKIGTGHLTIHLERSGKRLLIRISDDGVGMDEEVLSRMNERLGRSGQAFASQGSEMKRFEYLSIRVMALLAAALCIHLFLIAVLLFLAFMGHAPFWPAILSLVLLLGLLWWFGAMILKPYLHMERTMRLFLDGYTTADLTHLCQTAPTPMVYQMLAHMMKIMDSSELLKLNKRQAQYLALQNQINPHFLYNTLESIRSEALIAGLTGVADMTEALAAFFRYTISKVENLVSVEEELENCQTYFRIQQYRFGSRLDLTIECDPEEREEIYGCRLPKLTMQPILENSIIHGTECKIGTGHLTIHLERSGKRLLIRISDDGVGMDEEVLSRMNERLGRSGQAFASQGSETRGGIALVNVNNRIHLLFGEEYGLHVFSMPGVGTDVEINLPAIANDRELKNKEALK